MKSIYKRQFIQMAGMILVSFVLLGVAFIVLSYQYIAREKQTSIQRNANYISSYMAGAVTHGYNIRSDDVRAYLASTAVISDSYIVLSENSGEIVYTANLDQETDIVGSYMPESVLDYLKTADTYSSVSTLGGLFAERSYITAVPITARVLTYTEQGRDYQDMTLGFVVVAANASSIRDMWSDFTTLFLFTAVCVLLVALVTSSITSQQLTRPLQDLAQAANDFGRGEFKTRVTGYEERRDEVGKLAAAFDAMADSLAESEARRSEFVANVSHELKTPMTTIAGFADGILDGTIPPEKERESLQVISSETRRLSRLVRRMLDLSRLQSSERIAAQEQFDAKELLLRVLVSLEGKGAEKELEVETELPDAPVMVWGDPDVVTQVCYNLLDNAIKFSPKGGTLFLRITSKSGKAYVTVRNSGQTIPKDQLERIFDRFHKTDASRSSDRDGVGLGLYIVKTLLDTYKEDITVTSENGLTEFTFTLSEA